MKKALIIIMSLCLITSFTACGSKDKIKSENSINKVESKSENTEESQDSDNPLAEKTFPKFKAKDINGNDLNEEIFKNSKITMVNIWGTFCGPCIGEMPDLQKLYEANKDKGFSIIGLVSDGDTEESIEEGKKIISESKVQYTNVIPDKVLLDEIVNKFDYVPASIFVDSEGKILKTFVAGALPLEEYQKIVDGLLDK